ncbi:V-type ATP synthase subunit D [Anaerocaecibacter muris]|uniref:V-type ATP synthase subunit D n=1 Tax=Anaerocaecibacter muris TaxID=2941513 RepID=UPI00203BF55C|nr:V-type ATP synthase subunit D [Anaerocaecibacter muris]
MSRLNVNPTRMELRRLKDRLKTAERGHKLLKDKSDEMVRQFLVLIKENKRLREEIEGEIADALKAFAMSGGAPLEVVQAIALPTLTASVTVGTKNVMGVDVPYMQTKRVGEVRLPYALCSAPAELDDAVLKLTALADKLLHLAEVEKTCNMLADEIEKNRRRVNALEYVMIPQLQETIKYILMKLDENERAAIVRLMKVKDNT